MPALAPRDGSQRGFTESLIREMSAIDADVNGSLITLGARALQEPIAASCRRRLGVA